MTTTTKPASLLTLTLLALPFLLGARECEPEEPTVCTEEYAPVCGEDGVTYSNACHAESAGVGVDHDGECGPTLCWEDSECGTGERCGHETCYGAPCPEGADCAAVCYGACEPDPGDRLCLDASDCGELEYCHTDAMCRAPEPAGDEAALTACFGECRPRHACLEDRLCPAIDCAYGFATDEYGCPTCECAPEPPVCPAVLCDLACERGFATDEHGCPTCSCEEPPEPPVCAEVLCDIACEHGFATDDTGCPTCACAEPPPAVLCYADADCATGERCTAERDCLSACPEGEGCVDVCAGICEPAVAPSL